MGAFEQFADSWFDRSGPMGLLHAMNEVRVPYVQQFMTAPARGLDVGTGGGLVPLTLSPLGYIMEGLDQEESLIAQAKLQAVSIQQPIFYHCSSIEAFTPLAQYDFITCFEVIEHVDNPAIVCQRLLSWLKPGGWLFFSTINRTPAAYVSAILMAEYLLGWLPQQTHSFAQFVKPEELIAYLEPATCLNLRGMIYTPLEKQRFFLGESTSINYIGAWQKP